ncbi:hypothetical protein F4778DRAFT_757927 [Xylariomycetidae sp. FL2044]|nr:hypothetical protein F4778DRAFT_757927 [Xylariomycetidae sp. FL2044]
MATLPRSSSTCLSCLRRIVRPATGAALPAVSLPITQARGKMTKAELEDLQGIPVRLLQDIVGFGRKHAIIRVKPGRMRNYWFPRAQAEYMTRQRFQELGLTQAAIGVRDRAFGIKLLLDETQDGRTAFVEEVPTKDPKVKRKEALTLPAEETHALLSTLLPPTLTVVRKPIATPTPTPAAPPPPPEPAYPRSPSLALDAATSTGAPAPDEPAAAEEVAAPVVPIFGSVSTGDILAVIKNKLLAVDANQGSRVSLEAEGISILGLDEGEDRIKRLGSFEVLILPGKDLEPIKRTVKVVAEK